MMKATFSKKEIKQELERRASANRLREKPVEHPGVGLECIHCGMPVGFGGNSEFALCENCLHSD